MSMHGNHNSEKKPGRKSLDVSDFMWVIFAFSGVALDVGVRYQKAHTPQQPEISSSIVQSHATP